MAPFTESARAARRRRYGPSLVERVAEALGLDPANAPRLVGCVVRRATLGAVALLVVFFVLAVVLWPELEPIIRLLIQVGGE